jgi:non-ribosomal peptide synthetase component E (peptide arylation enzyme)
MPPGWANFGVGSWIERRARIAPGRLALVGDDRSLTYAELAGSSVASCGVTDP